MNIKTVTGPTIQAALTEARRLLGDNVVLLESVPPEGTNPATIRVAVDLEPSAPVEIDSTPVVEPVGFGYAAQRRGSTVHRGFRASQPASEKPTLPRHDPWAAQSARPSVISSSKSPGRQFEAESDGDPVGRELRAVQERLRELEELVRTQKVRRGGWKTIGILTRLHAAGVSENTLEELCLRINTERHNTGRHGEHVDVVQSELRRRLQMPVQRPVQSALMVMGSTGAGKTSLLLKMARHPEYYGRRRTAALLVRPSGSSGDADLTSVEAYHRAGVAVQSVSSREEMRHALERVDRFDHILLDTPSLPVDPAAAHGMCERLRDVVSDVMPLHVQLVLDATRVMDAGTLSAWTKLPLRPASVAIAHLDETRQWGRFAEWLMDLELPYGYASEGAHTENLCVLSAARIVEQLTRPD